MKITNIKKITPKPSLCISVDSTDKLFEVGSGDNKILTHNSVSQQNILISCILRPENWVVLGIDLKRVELTRFRDFGVKVATQVDTAVEFLRFAQAVMMKRYESMENSGENDFRDLPGQNQALLVMIDEAAELLVGSGVKALSEQTFIPNANDRKNLGELQVGDTVYNSNQEPVQVVKKYEPEEQQRFNMKITSDTTGASEEFISGAEHFWVVYFENTSGTLDGPHTMDTASLKGIIDVEKAKPLSEQRKLKIRKGTPMKQIEEWFTIDFIEETDNDDKLYCIAVDSPDKQFLIGEIEVPTHNTDEGKEEDALKGEAKMIIGSIARLGRAAGVHLVIATQRPDAEIIGGEMRDNLTTRIACGRMKSSGSTMMFSSGIGERIHSSPKGGMYIQVHGEGNMGQGFYAPNSWLEDYYNRNNLKMGETAVLADNADSMPSEESAISNENPVDTWDEDMDEILEMGE